jgi:hypothetical protein
MVSAERFPSVGRIESKSPTPPSTSLRHRQDVRYRLEVMSRDPAAAKEAAAIYATETMA